MENIENSYRYQAWIFDQLEPDIQQPFTGRSTKNPREIKGWQMRNYNPELSEREKEEREDEFLKRHEIKSQNNE